MKHTSRCSPMMRRPRGTSSSLLALSRKVGKSGSSSTRYLPGSGFLSPGSPATAVCAAPAVQQSTHGGRRGGVGHGARPGLPEFPRVVSKRRRDRQLSWRACTLESRYDPRGQIRDDVPPGPQGVKSTRTSLPELTATPVLGHIVGTRPQAVIHLIEIHACTNSRPSVRARLFGAAAVTIMNADLGALRRAYPRIMRGLGRPILGHACMHHA